MEIKRPWYLFFSVFKQFSLFRHLNQDFSYYTTEVSVSIFTVSKYILWYHADFLTTEFKTAPQMKSTYTFYKFFNIKFWKLSGRKKWTFRIKYRKFKVAINVLAISCCKKRYKTPGIYYQLKKEMCNKTEKMPVKQ